MVLELAQRKLEQLVLPVQWERQVRRVPREQVVQEEQSVIARLLVAAVRRLPRVDVHREDCRS